MSTDRQSVHLATVVSQYIYDPLQFVLDLYPWGEPGELENETGPDENQAAFLRDLGSEAKARRFDGSTPVMPILMAENSGHGTGKSAMGAWIADWILSTRPFSVGTITAGTYTQLETRTWAAIRRWTKLCLTAPWFDIGASIIKHKFHPEDWKIVAQTCKQENAQAFAGQHAKNSTSWYLFDEASEVPDAIWDTAKGGLTDGEPMWFAWGQPVRNSGVFHRVCFGREAARWVRRSVDSRTSRFANKTLIQQWIEDYGIDSDFVRVRVLGLPPLADELQYIDSGRVKRSAQTQGGIAPQRSVDRRLRRLRRRCGVERDPLPPRQRRALDSADPDQRRERARPQRAGRSSGRGAAGPAAGAADRRHVHRLGLRGRHSTNGCGRWDSTTFTK